MTQADSAHTTTLPRVAFSSAGAVRRARHAAVLPPCQLAHQALMAALAAETPHAIIGYAADRFDILERADHLKTILTEASRRSGHRGRIAQIHRTEPRRQSMSARTGVGFWLRGDGPMTIHIMIAGRERFAAPYDPQT